MDIRPAEVADLRELDALRRREQEAVGFIPLSRYEALIAHTPAQLLTGWEGGDLVSYLYWTAGLPVAAIQQLVVRPDARRRDRGTTMVAAAVTAMDHVRRYGVTCRCRVDLESVDFWVACGFQACRLEQGGRRGPCVRFYRQLRPTLLPLGLYLPSHHAAGGPRRGFRYIRPPETSPPVYRITTAELEALK